MRHKLKYRKLGRKTTNRMSMLMSQVSALFKYGKIKITKTRAKEVRRLAERIIASAKYNTLAVKRKIAAKFRGDRSLVKKAIELGVKYEGRPGGFTRIIKLGKKRKGDGAEMALLELV
ncbi:50S ribosomal protein L17 [Candidatus Margulisiibacteriota bacterium]